MAKRLKSIMEADNEINDIEDLLKDQEPEVEKSGEDIFESEDEENKDDEIEVDENEDEDEDKDLDENEDEDDEDKDLDEDIEKIDEPDEDLLNAIGKVTSNEGKSKGSEEVPGVGASLSENDDFDTGEDNSDEIFESDDADEEDKELDENEDEDEDEDDEDKKDLDESKLSPKELKIVMESLKIPASSKKEIKIVFESMVANKLKAEKALIEKKAEKKVAKIREELIEATDLYAKEVVRKWKEANKPVFESKAKLARLEEGFHKLAEIFSSLGFETTLNESEISKKYTTIVKRHKELLERNQKLEAYVERIQVKELYEGYLTGMSKNQRRKFVSLAETLEFDTIKDLKEKLDAIKKLFVEKKTYENDELEDNEVNEDEFNDDGVLTPDENDLAGNDALVNESLKLLMSQ